MLKFREAARRLYYYDTVEKDSDSTILVTTVENNMSKFSAYDVSRAKLARSIQRRLGVPALRISFAMSERTSFPTAPSLFKTSKLLNSYGGLILEASKEKQSEENHRLCTHKHLAFLWVLCSSIVMLLYLLML